MQHANDERDAKLITKSPRLLEFYKLLYILGPVYPDTETNVMAKKAASKKKVARKKATKKKASKKKTAKRR